MKELKLSGLLPSFLAECDCRTNSIARYALEIELFHRWIVKHDLTLATCKKEHFIDYKKYLLESKQITTVRNYMTSVRVFYHWLEANSIINDITLNVKLPRQEDTIKRRDLSPKEAKRLIESIDRSTDIGKRNYAIINLMLRCGLRKAELLSITIGDIVQIGIEFGINIRRKGDYQKRLVPITSCLFDIIENYITTRSNISSEDPLFICYANNRKHIALKGPTVYSLVKKAFERIGLTGSEYTSHSLRHTAINLALDAPGSDLQTAMVFANHKSIAVTQLYLKGRQRRLQQQNTLGKKMDELLK
jgi:site-specific recombinase XerD